MTPVQAFLAYVVGPLIVSGGAFVAAVYTGRTSRRAATSTADAQNRATEMEGMDRLVNRLEHRLSAVEGEAEACRAENRRLDERIEILERELFQTRTSFNALREYARTLRRVLHSHSIEVPDPPPALVEHLGETHG